MEETKVELIVQPYSYPYVRIGYGYVRSLLLTSHAHLWA